VFNKMFPKNWVIKQIDRYFRVRIYAICTLVVFVSGTLIAQEAATSLEDLKFVVGKGDKVTLVDASGKKISGRVERVAPNTLEIKTGGTLQSFSERDVRQITRQKPDSPWNGVAIGAGVGFGATLPLFLVASEGERGWAVAGAAVWGLIGGGIGALVDAAVHEKQTVYVQPRSRASFSISPFYSNSSLRLQTFGARALQSGWQQNGGTDPSKGIAVTLHF
jgi:hypothetical protein